MIGGRGAHRHPPIIAADKIATPCALPPLLPSNLAPRRPAWRAPCSCSRSSRWSPLAALAFALATGSVGVDPLSIVRGLMGEDSSGRVAIVRELRLPRALCAFAVGGLLAVAGALLQVLLRNPLADPYVLGISGGAAVGALTALSAGVAVLAMPAAFTGAFASTLVVFGLARAGRIDAPWTAMRLLLTGVVVAAGWGAVIALLLTLAPDAQLRGMLFWLLGDLSAPPSPVRRARRAGGRAS